MDKNTPKTLHITQSDYRGHVDVVSNSILHGWAVSRSNPDTPVELVVSIDDRPIGACKATEARSDLRDLGIRRGFVGFSFKIPKAYLDGKPHAIRVEVANTKIRLPGLKLLNACVVDQNQEDARLIFDDWLLATHGDRAELAARIARRRKVAILATYWPSARLPGFVTHLAGSLTEAGYVVVWSHATDPEQAPRPEAFDADLVFVKKNEGYDFGSWGLALGLLSTLLDEVDELLLMNDSSFGPAGSGGMAAIPRPANAEALDFWGMTDSYDGGYHIQSYYMLFKRQAIKALLSFFAAYPYGGSKEDAIRYGEIGLTRSLLNKGLRAGAVYDYTTLAGQWIERQDRPVKSGKNGASLLNHPQLDFNKHLIRYINHVYSCIRLGTPLNPSHHFFDVLLDLGCPFIKRELLYKNPTKHPFHYMAAQAFCELGYDPDLIRDVSRRQTWERYPLL